MRSGWCVPAGEVTDLILPFSCSAWCPQGCPRHLWLARLGFGPRCSPPRDAMGTHGPAPACADQPLPPGSSPRAALLCKKQIPPRAGLRREPKTLFLMAKAPSVHPGKGFPWCNQTPTASLPGGGTSAGPASPLFFSDRTLPAAKRSPKSPKKPSVTLSLHAWGRAMPRGGQGRRRGWQCCRRRCCRSLKCRCWHFLLPKAARKSPRAGEEADFRVWRCDHDHRWQGLGRARRRHGTSRRTRALLPETCVVPTYGNCTKQTRACFFLFCYFFPLGGARRCPDPASPAAAIAPAPAAGRDTRGPGGTSKASL